MTLFYLSCKSDSPQLWLASGYTTPCRKTVSNYYQTMLFSLKEKRSQMLWGSTGPNSWKGHLWHLNIYLVLIGVEYIPSWPDGIHHWNRQSQHPQQELDKSSWKMFLNKSIIICIALLSRFSVLFMGRHYFSFQFWEYHLFISPQNHSPLNHSGSLYLVFKNLKSTIRSLQDIRVGFNVLCGIIQP